MSRRTKAALVFVISTAIGSSLFWYGGVDWTVRSTDHAMALALVLWVSAGAAFLTAVRP